MAISAIRAPTLPIIIHGKEWPFAHVRFDSKRCREITEQPFVSASASSFCSRVTHLSASLTFIAASCSAISIRMTTRGNFYVKYRSSKKVFPWLSV